MGKADSSEPDLPPSRIPPAELRRGSHADRAGSARRSSLGSTARKNSSHRLHGDPICVHLNDAEVNRKARHAGNFIRTSKYKAWNFLPKNLFDQFRRIANFYFLVVFLIQLVPGLSPISAWSSLAPLVAVLAVGALKEGIEDYRRHQADNAANNAKFRVLRPHTPDAAPSLRWVLSKDIAVGDVVVVGKGQCVPCDLVLLSSSMEDGRCYVETSNLDGESNLKQLECPPETAHLRTLADLGTLRGVVTCEQPSTDLYRAAPRPRPPPPPPGTRWPPGFHASLALAKEDGPLPPAPSLTASASRRAVPLGPKQLLLRGVTVRNTRWAAGLAVYAGRNTKLSLNQKMSSVKISRIDKRLNRYILYIFVLQITLCIIAGIVSGVMHRKGDEQWYLGYNPWSQKWADWAHGLFHVLSYFILVQAIIPISLIVSLEIVRVWHVAFMQWDEGMRLDRADEKSGMRAKTSNLTDELGQVEHIFSDKTGTLTENRMVFARCAVPSALGGGLDHFSERAEGPALALAAASSHAGVRELLSVMSVCHAVVPERGEGDAGQHPDLEAPLPARRPLPAPGDLPRPTFARVTLSGRMSRLSVTPLPDEPAPAPAPAPAAPPADENGPVTYAAQSPDEGALVKAAAGAGYVLKRRTPESVVVAIGGEDEAHEVLATLDFTPERQRMSLLVRRRGRILLYSKGADVAMLGRLGPHERAKEAVAALTEFSGEGLRTLVFAAREVPEREYAAWREGWEAAATAIADRDEKMTAAFELLERDMRLVGCTGVEDQLQAEVPATVAFLRRAGIVVWLLTGDKLETAVNVGFSAELLHRDMDLFVVSAADEAECRRQLMAASRALERTASLERAVAGRQAEGGPAAGPAPGVVVLDTDSEEGRRARRAGARPARERALVIDGATLTIALERHEELLLAACTASSAVICCRVSPLQKALVVRMVKRATRKVCLAVGDGANDVSMIQEADVGIGILGKEGSQAARASDYAIHEFRHLRRLLCVHGRYNYLRIAHLLNYCFYKNLVWVLPQFWYLIYCLASAQTLYDDWLGAPLNLVYTALPPIFVAVFDRDAPEAALLAHPELYRRMHSDSHFNMRTLAVWYASALWHSLVAFFGTVLLFGRGEVLSGLGLALDQSSLGLIAANLVVFILLAKSALETRLWNLFHVLGIVVGIAGFYIWAAILDASRTNFNSDFAGVPRTAWALPAGWLWLPLGLVAALCPDLAAKYLARAVAPQDWQVAQETVLAPPPSAASTAGAPLNASLKVLVEAEPKAEAKAAPAGPAWPGERLRVTPLSSIAVVPSPGPPAPPPQAGPGRRPAAHRVTSDASLAIGASESVRPISFVTAR